MSYPNFPSIGIPSSGFASRGKGAHIKRLSFEPSLPSGSQGNGAPTPRTSRSHLLAGLRTAPKSATTGNFPPSAPPSQLQHRTGLESSMYSDNKENARPYGIPKTSVGSSFPTHQTAYNPSRQMYSLPEQVLAPPEIQIDEQSQEQMDPNLYAQLVATNMYLAEQQQRLQQQLINVQAAAQQFQGMNLGQMGHQTQQQFATPPITPNMGMYQQQANQSMQPIVTPVMGQSGIYYVYNPMTGQQSYFIDQNAQQAYPDTQQTPNSFRDNNSPQQPGTPRFQVSPPTNNTPLRSNSPPKKSTSPPQDHSPLPPPSANAFRRGHKKASSLANVINAATTTPNVETGPRSAIPKSNCIPATPMTGTFGPGQARAGEHPIRQPRGPPSLDELLAKPTTKFEGSKNFATRQRRNAVHNLVRAGLERRRTPGSGSGSAGSITPISEQGEITFSISSDNDSDSGTGSSSLSGPSLDSSRTSAHGVIGSDRPSSRQKERSQERNSVDSNFTTASVSSDEETSVGGSFAAVFKNGAKKAEGTEPERRKAPMLVLTSAEKRKSAIY
jgi:hypothetical protein